MKHLNLPTAALALFALAACIAQDENENPNGRTALQVTTAAITTRATDNAWEASDAIGITLLEAGTATPVDGKNACKYVTSTAAGNFSPADKENTAFFPTQGKSADVFSFYPYQAIGSELLVPVSTASQASLSSIDLMTATPARGHSAVNPAVTLDFGHRLSKLTITVDKEASAGDVDLSGATLTVVGTATTAQWSLTAEKLTNEANIADIAVPTSTTTADAMSATAIVLPTAAGKDVKLIVTTKDGQRSYTAPLDAATALMAGTEHFLNVHLKHTQATVSVTIADWTTGKTLDLPSLSIDVTATDGTAAGIHTLALWSSANATAKADYTFDAATSKWSSPAPFYLENLTDTDAFFARHTPTTTDAVSTLADVLGNTVAATQKGGGIGLEMQHLMSKLNVSLAGGTNFPGAADLAGATLTLNGFKQTFELSDANLATATGTAAAYTATADASGAASLTVIPQTLATGTEFTATLKNGATYTANLAAALTLEAGMIHTLTLTLNPTETKIALTLAEWGTGSNDTQTIIVDGITADGSGVSLAATEGDQLTLSTEIGTSATYAYSTTAWSTAAPLYWDDFAQGQNYAFNALFTPATAPVGANEVDYRHGSATVAFGAPIAFDLAHSLSAVKMTLQTGTGFTDLKGATIALQSILPLASIANDGTTTLGTTTANPTMNIVTDGKEYALIIAPQTFAAGSTLAVITLGGHTYSVNVPSGTTLNAAAGMIASLDITLNKKEVGQITITLPSWGEGDKLTGDGEYED